MQNIQTEWVLLSNSPLPTTFWCFGVWHAKGSRLECNKIAFAIGFVGIITIFHRLPAAV